jgi:Dolichyl-phosphate-mannose-protein mannosyltransferase
MTLRMQSSSWNPRRARTVVVAVAAAALVAKLILAANTLGPADVRFFEGFSQAIAASGPIRIYAQPLDHLPVYNHPPLAGWMLLGFDGLAGWGIPFSTLIRIPACFADFVTSILVFEIARRRTRLSTAAYCALGAALCPVLVATSAYHGNTDSVAVMFALAAAYLLADRGSPVLAGLAAVLSISVKLVPVVAVPLLFLAAWRLGGRAVLARFTVGFMALFLPVWGPALVTVPGPLKEKVLEYKGGGYRLWGLIRFADWAGVPEPVIAFLRGDGHFIFVLVCTAAGLWLGWRRPAALPVAVATTLGLLLLLSTASGAQYLAWPAAGLFVIGLWEGLAYALVVGTLTSLVYGLHHAVRWTDGELALGVAGWLLLGLGVVSGVRTVIGAGPEDGPPADGITPPAVGHPRAEAPTASPALRIRP